MKKISLILLCILSLFIITGCESNSKDRQLLFNALIREKIISSSMKQIDEYSHSFYSTEWCFTNNYHVYKDNNSKIIIVEYTKSLSDDKYKHIVTIYPNVTLNKNIETIKEENASCEDGYYKYNKNEYTKNNKYNYKYEQAETYYAIEKKVLGIKYYSLEQKKEIQ